MHFVMGCADRPRAKSLIASWKFFTGAAGRVAHLVDNVREFSGSAPGFQQGKKFWRIGVIHTSQIQEHSP
jgi:hypothetical protein